MDDTLKQRVVGLCILVFLAVVFVPFIFDGKGLKKEQSMRGEILDLPTTQQVGQPEQFTTVLTLDKPKPQSTVVSSVEHNRVPDTTLKPTSEHLTNVEQKNKPIPRLPQNAQANNTLKPLPKSDEKPKQIKPKKPIKASNPSKPKPVKSTPPEPKPVALPKSGWLVQVGGFSNKKNALGLKKKLEQQGFKAFVKTNSDSNFFRVRVGIYSTKEQALKAREKLARLHKVKPILVKY